MSLVQMTIPMVPMLHPDKIDAINRRVARLVRTKIGNEIERTRWERKEGRYATLSAEEVLELSRLTGIRFTDLVLQYGAGSDRVSVATMNTAFEQQGDTCRLGEVETTEALPYELHHHDNDD